MRRKLKTMNDKLAKDAKINEYYNKKNNSAMSCYKKTRKDLAAVLTPTSASPKSSSLTIARHMHRQIEPLNLYKKLIKLPIECE